MIAKYLATSLAIENVVSAPRVIKSCLPISTTSISLVGLESRSTMLPASRAACVPVFMADQLQFVFGRRLREEIVDAGFGGDSGGRHRVIARDHHGTDAHAAQLGKALADAALDDILQLNHAE